MGDHEELVDLGRNIGGVEVSIFMREFSDCYRISLRSNGLVNVNEIAKKFGGGGHKMAAGIKLTTNFKETKNNLINAIKEELDKQ
jgi:phosphoesterase RecJ-like protein